MANQYWVGDFFVDISRNQISKAEDAQTVAPKALAVLTCLAQNPGKVVSQDTLLTAVWQNTAVTPNTLQRSIAQLRKALGDDGKVQRYIKTHAKQGYSLDCQVRWQNESEAPAVPNRDAALSAGPAKPEHSPATGSVRRSPNPGWLRWSVLLGLIAVLSLLGYRLQSSEPPVQLSFSAIRSLTATDDKEFDATYSPDGQYVVFHRYLNKYCVNKIWAKHIETQREIQLTQDWGNYGSHSFSKDGKTLVFLATEACDDTGAQTDCYDLMQIDFEKALETPQQPSLILRCENSQLKNPQWISADAIGMLQRVGPRWKLIAYSTSEKTSRDLFQLEDVNVFDFTYSAGEDLIAAVSFRPDGRQYLDLLEANGRPISSHPIDIPAEMPEFRPIFPSFAPLDDQLIFSTGRQLFTLSYTGAVTKISLPFADRMVQPEFHPDGHSLLMLKGPYDGDIVLLNRDQVNPTTAETSPSALATLPSFERSNLGEDYAKFQPGGELIAFWSERSGEEQLWISDGRGAQQLTHFPIDTRIRGFAWAADGLSLLVNANYALNRVTLNGDHQSFPFAYPVVQLYQWDSESNRALLLARRDGILKLVDYDLTQDDMQEITDQTVSWAQRSADGRLVYMDYQGRFWQPGPIEDQRIKVLDGQGARAKSFIMEGQVIYAINKEHQMWHYHLDEGIFRILGDVPEHVDHLTDISPSQLLMTVMISAKKEVVELSVNPSR